MTSALSGGTPDAHFLRIYPALSTQSVDGILPIKDPLVSRDPYPAPGQAAKDKQTTVVGKR